MNRRLLVALFAMIYTWGLPTTHAAEKPGQIEPYRRSVGTIISHALTDGQTYAKLKELCQAAPHRLAGSTGAAAAVEWARQTMIADGMENVRLEPCLVPHWVRGDVEELRMVSPPEAAGERLPILALGRSVGTPTTGITAEVVEVKSFEELRNLGESARGKIIFYNRPFDDTLLDTFSAYGGAVNQRSRGAIEAAKAGGVAAIVRSMTTLLDDVPHTGAMSSYPDTLPKLPAAAVSTLGAERISALLAAGKKVTLHMKMDCRMLEDVPSYNVVGELVGREKPEEIVVIGGHLDAWDVSQGAHDDGAGCCQSIDAIRLLKELNLQPRRTIRAVMFMNEENGTRGARAYVKDHASEMAQHIFALESDRGGFTPRGFSTNANPAAMAILQEIGKLLAPIGIQDVVRGYSGVDISYMRKHGVITMGYVPDSQRYFDVHHSAHDVIENVNQRELELGTAAVAAMAYIVADLEGALLRNEMKE